MKWIFDLPIKNWITNPLSIVTSRLRKQIRTHKSTNNQSLSLRPMKIEEAIITFQA